MIEDYAQALLNIKALRAKAYTAMQQRNWKVACDCADEVIVEARKVRIYCLDQLEATDVDQ